eukprot:jgi/Undpi1/5045/HiC_scaffold_19.g08397.m1
MVAGAVVARSVGEVPPPGMVMVAVAALVVAAAAAVVVVLVTIVVVVVAVAVALADGKVGRGGSGGTGGAGEEEAETEELTPLVVKKYACQRPTPMRHHNEEVTSVLDLMTQMYKVTGDGVRADSYQRAASVLRSLPRRIRSGSEVSRAHHVGPRMVESIDEILTTGTLGRLEELKSPRNCVYLELCKVHGVGPTVASAWYKSGVRSVDDARQRLALGDEKASLPLIKAETVLGLRHFDDLQVPITREEVSEIAREVRAEAERFGRERDREGTVFFEVCGGFRRGKESLHDVDMLVSFRTRNGDSGHEGFVERNGNGVFLQGELGNWRRRKYEMKERLVGSGKLCATLFQGQLGGFGNQKADGGGRTLEREEVLLGLWQMDGGRKCRVDIVQVALFQWPFALLGWSGTVMFQKDLRRFVEETTDLKLSQMGLVERSTELPLTEAFVTEEDIFRRLGLEFIPPHLRWA